MGEKLRTGCYHLSRTDCSIFGVLPSVMVTTDENELERFSQRINQICDLMGISPDGEGRQIQLAEIFGISQKGARKWLKGEAFPRFDNMIRIAKWSGVMIEWLATGRGPQFLPLAVAEGDAIYVSDREKSLLENIRQSTDEDLQLIERIALLSSHDAQRNEDDPPSKFS